MERDVLVILASRAARTFPLGILGVVLPIYLASFGSSILGLFFTISVVSSTSLLVVLSFLGHRFNIVLVLMIQTLFIAASLFMLSLSSTLILVLAAAAMSITNWAPGGGSGTGGGAYNTSVNILLSQRSERKSRTLALSLSSTIGSLSYAAGAYFLSLSKIANPAPGSQLIHGFASSPADLFALSALIEIVSIGILVMVIRKKEAPLQNVSSRDPGNAKVSSGGKVWNVLRTVLSFAVAEFSNGLGNGLFTQLAPLWFYLRFGISIAAVGQIFAGAGVITAFLILFSTRIEKRMGQTKSIFLMRAGYGALLFATALAPSLIAALILYYTSLILARIAAPIQQSLVFTRVQKEEWARGSSMIAISNLAGTSIGPLFGSFLLLNVNIALPMMLAFPFIFISAMIYTRIQTS